MDYPQAFVSIIILIICIIIGLPVWWNTTKVYRAELPHEQILNLAKTQFRIKVKLNVILPLNVKIESKDLFERLNTYEMFEFDVKTFRKDLKVGAIIQETCEMLLGETEHSDLTYQLAVYNDKTTSDVKYSFCSHSDLSQQNTSSMLSMLVSIPDEILTDVNNVIGILLKPIEKYLSESNIKSSFVLDKRQFESRLPPSGKYRIDFALAIVDPNDYDTVSWDIKTVTQTYLKSVLDEIDFLGPFDVSSQVLYFSDVNLKPNKGEDHSYFTKSKLSLLINSLKSRLNTYTSTDVGLNFVVYVPARKDIPLYIKSKKVDSELSTAFHSARWGGVQFYWPTQNSTKEIQIPMKTLMGIFIDQLKVLVGLTEMPEFFQNSDISVRLSRTFSRWSTTKLRLERTYEHLQKSISTLTSLSQLLDSIANIVIRDDIKLLIDDAVENIEKSIDFASMGETDKAYMYSKQAYLKSEKAFYDSSLLALLYFPDDQKYAIYVPLFLPIALPILISFVKAVKWLKQTSVEGKEKVE